MDFLAACKSSWSDWRSLSLPLAVAGDRKTWQLSTAIVVFFPTGERKPLVCWRTAQPWIARLWQPAVFPPTLFLLFPFASRLPKETTRSILGVMTQLARPRRGRRCRHSRCRMSLFLALSTPKDVKVAQALAKVERHDKCPRENSCNLVVYSNKNAHEKIHEKRAQILQSVIVSLFTFGI